METEKSNNDNYEMALELWRAISDYHLIAMGAFSGEGAVTYWQSSLRVSNGKSVV